MTFRAYVTIALILGLLSAAMPQTIEWQGRFGSSSPVNDRLFKSLTDSSGNQYVFSNARGLVTISKFDAAGTLAWQQFFANKKGLAHTGGGATLDANGNLAFASVDETWPKAGTARITCFRVGANAGI